MNPASPKYQRIVLKISGEALRKAGSLDNISPEIVGEVAQSIKEVHGRGVQVAVVVGGGNIWRGAAASNRGMDRTMADYMGMLATIMNGIALQKPVGEESGWKRACRRPSRSRTSPSRTSCGRRSATWRKAAWSSSSPGPATRFFTTDTTAALRASEIGAQVILKGDQGGTASTLPDPMKDPTATRYEWISYTEALSNAAPGYGRGGFQPVSG